MKVVVFGASKGIGRAVVTGALARGHEVTAFARHPENLQAQANLRLVAGDVLNAAQVAAAVKGHDAVLCTLGLGTRLAIGPPVAPRSYVLTKGIANIIAGMESHHVSRLMVVTAIGSGESVRDCKPLLRFAMRSGLRWLFAQKDRQEEAVRRSNLDWTIVRPTALTNGPGGKSARPYQKIRAGLFSHISRSDVAGFLLDQLVPDQFRRQAIIISNPPNRLADPWRFVKDFH